MNVDLNQRAARGPDGKRVHTPFPSPLRATTHACARYAQRVLGMNVGELDVLNAPALRGRCERGIARLLERARPEAAAEGAERWIAGTRALVLANTRVVTLMVAPTNKGFSKQFVRRFAVWERAA